VRGAVIAPAKRLTDSIRASVSISFEFGMVQNGTAALNLG
jgi:hypothetical protein